ncbi:helix-turn-helix domain-containing protein [Hahella sp. NBU794]|uniref:helix-turn-helix domain-containing protein n=1 Tax=Hahella sp. NBU794 TaxID=3422590 RepID=UPI003D6F966A
MRFPVKRALILTIKDVADYLKVNERTIYRLTASIELPDFKVGSSWRFKQSEREQYISAQHYRAIAYEQNELSAPLPPAHLLDEYMRTVQSNFNQTQYLMAKNAKLNQARELTVLIKE